MTNTDYQSITSASLVVPYTSLLKFIILIFEGSQCSWATTNISQRNTMSCRILSSSSKIFITLPNIREQFYNISTTAFIIYSYTHLIYIIGNYNCLPYTICLYLQCIFTYTLNIDTYKFTFTYSIGTTLLDYSCSP